MPVACVRIPHFALRVATEKQPYLEGSPLVLTREQGNRALVIDATAEATRTGVRAGQNVREAYALCPVAVILTPDPVREATTAQQILMRLLAVSPLVEPDDHEPGCWYVDLIGLERYYGTQEHAAQRIMQCIPESFRPRTGIAPSKFAARVAASGTEGGVIRILTERDVRPFLAQASIQHLPVPTDLLNSLQKLGVHTLGVLADLPRSKVIARYGEPGRLAWDLANGIDRRQVISPQQIPAVTETITLESPVVSREMLMVSLRHLVTRAFRKRDLRGRYVREITLSALLEQGASWERTLQLKEPSDAPRLLQALTLRLQLLEMPGPITKLAITLTGILDEALRQQTFALLKPRNDTSLTHVAEQLKQRYGSSPLYRVVEVEPWSRIPERRHALLTYDP